MLQSKRWYAVMLTFLAMTFFLLCSMSFTKPTAAISGNTVATSSLPESIVQEALKIISTAGEGGLKDSDMKQLAALGLSDSQIEMLKNLSLTEDSASNQKADRLLDSWTTKQSVWDPYSAMFLFFCGIAVAGGMIGLLAIARKIFSAKKGQHIREHKKHFVNSAFPFSKCRIDKK